MAKDSSKSSKDAKTTETKTTRKEHKTTPKCGIIMPISDMGDYTEQHWKDVREMIEGALEDTDFQCDLVSNAKETRVIHNTIVQNIYDNEIVVCDVSGKNPNVMFELGLRLAFDKPAIIIKDEKTSYSFDTGIIEHLPYPSGFNYKEVMKFQTTLKEKVIHTYEKGKDPNYSPFVGHFDRIKVAEIETEEVSKDDYIIEMFNEIKDSLAEIQLIQKPTLSSGLRKKMVNIDFDKI